MSERQPLVYVLSNGRSGSTLLDGLLGAHARVFSAGELQVLPHEVQEDRAPCACGEPVRACSFWGPLLDALPLALGAGGLAAFRERHNQGRVLRWRHFADLLRGRPGAQRAREVDAYADATWRAVAAIRARAVDSRGVPVDWVVDASKDAYRLLWLAASGRFDLRVVHLVRDPRAFVHAMTKADARASAGRVARFAGRWIVENLAMARLVSRALPPEHVKRVRYEDLAREPERVLGELGAWLALDDLAACARTFRGVEQHAVAGGRMRFDSGGIRPDEAWRERMAPAAARFVGLVTAPAARCLGL